MFRHTIPLGRIFVSLSTSTIPWFLVFGLLTWMLAVSSTSRVSSRTGTPLSIGSWVHHRGPVLCERVNPRAWAFACGHALQGSSAPHHFVYFGGVSQIRENAKR